MNAEFDAKELADFVVHECRLLDGKRFEEWNALFSDDGIYWVPASPDQPDGDDWTSHMYEDKLLRSVRIERLKSPRAFSQQPPSRCHHLLQAPTVEGRDPDTGLHVVRTEFIYSEATGDTLQHLAGTMFHHLRREADGALKIVLKRVNLINCDAALEPVQLFI